MNEVLGMPFELFSMSDQEIARLAREHAEEASMGFMATADPRDAMLEEASEAVRGVGKAANARITAVNRLSLVHEAVGKQTYEGRTGLASAASVIAISQLMIVADGDALKLDADGCDRLFSLWAGGGASESGRSYSIVGEILLELGLRAALRNRTKAAEEGLISHVVALVRHNVEGWIDERLGALANLGPDKESTSSEGIEQDRRSLTGQSLEELVLPLAARLRSEAEWLEPDEAVALVELALVKKDADILPSRRFDGLIGPLASRILRQGVTLAYEEAEVLVELVCSDPTARALVEEAVARDLEKEGGKSAVTPGDIYKAQRTKKTNAIDYGKRLLEARSKRKHTTQELADSAGVSKAQIVRYENGYSMPTLEVRQRLARVLGKDLENAE